MDGLRAPVFANAPDDQVDGDERGPARQFPPFASNSEGVEVRLRPAVCCFMDQPGDGAFMEQSGRNRWQPVANGITAKTARTSQNRCRELRPVANRSAW
jgi:hypothetical protein